MAKIDKLLEGLKEHLEKGETISKYVVGLFEGKMFGKDTLRDGILASTDKRIVFYAKKMFSGFEMEVFPYQNISSIEMSKGLTGYKISMFTSGNSATMKMINHGDVPSFIQDVKSKIGKKESSQLSQDDVIDKLERLAKLKEQGILTEAEFLEQKRRILA